MLGKSEGHGDRPHHTKICLGRSTQRRFRRSRSMAGSDYVYRTLFYVRIANRSKESPN